MALHEKSRLTRWYDTVAAFKVEDLFSRKKAPGPRRTIFVNENLPQDYFDAKGRVKKEHIYASSQVITSKYTIITFLPRNLLEQFRRIANIFFLGIAVLQFFSIFSTISPGLVILPLLIVLGITAIKDGYEDIKRHQSDRHVNNSQVRVLSGGDWVNPNLVAPKSRTFVRGLAHANRNIKKIKNLNSKGEELQGVTSPALLEDTNVEYDEEPEGTTSHLFARREDHSKRPHWKLTNWEDVRVGDFVKIMDNEPLPADMLICSTSEDENVAFVETKNLDGETNLKSRNAAPALTHIRTASDCASPHNVFRVDCDRPDVNLYKMNATIQVGKDVFPLDIQTTLLRGTVLRNTKWVIGIVMFTGEDTKIVMNSGGTPSKRSRVERQMNPQVFINLILLALMAVACAIVDSVLEHRYYPLGAPWLYGETLSDDNPSINGLITFAFALITFQNIVPISLYISIEFVRTCQAAFIHFDSEIFYEKTGQASVARSWNLSDDLGQIQYIFSDKTGTLTQNSMVFQKCSIGGKVYNGDEHDDEEEHTETLVDEKHIQLGRISTVSKDKALSTLPSRDTAPPDNRTSSGGSSTAAHAPSPSPPQTHQTPQTAVPNKLTATSPKAIVHFRDADLLEDLQKAVHAGPNSSNSAHARNLNGFFSVLALCHTVIASVDPHTGAIEYKAQSPDEAALVQAAADMGFIFHGRDRETLTIQTPFSGVGDIEGDGMERYELLNILEFTSSRKRMSVVLRKLDTDDARIFLLCKGADNVIFERLKPGNPEMDELKRTTERHLDDFASQGLRTLTLAYKVVSEDEYTAWSERYQEASLAMDDREDKVEAVSDELEQDLRLLGATAIEDKLQDGVPETIEDLKRAGIKIWVATGDKLETAIAIGHSTNLIGRESNIIIIRGGNESGRLVYDQMMHAVDQFFPESNILDEQKALRPPTSPAQSPPLHGQQENPLRRMNTGISSIVGSNNGDRPGGFVLVIDGSGLAVALSDQRHKSLLLGLAMLCEGVICCRVSPLQKALVVKLVKDGLGAMTLAIGDGANDVSMIQAADVGVGISGEEGLQAVNSSDYAIAQFRFLKRLILVHGHWSYARNGNMILNFFYKNIVCIGVLWWFQIYCGWSSNYVFDYTYLLFWNSFWTIAPVIGIGLFDRLADAHVLMDLPELYHFGREGKWFGMTDFIIYMLDGIVQSAIIFFIILYAYFTTTSRPDGWDIALYEFSTTMVFAAAWAANMYNGLNTTVWTGWVFFAVFIGTIVLYIFTAVYNAISPGWIVTFVWGNNIFLFESAYFWLCVPLVVCLSLTPRYVAKAWKFGYAPDDIDIVRYIRKTQPDRDLARDPQSRGTLAAMARPLSQTESLASFAGRPSLDIRASSRTDMSTGMRSVHRGFDFSTEENGVAIRRMQSNLSERRQSSRNLPSTHGSPGRRIANLGHVFSVRRNFLRRKGPAVKDSD